MAQDLWIDIPPAHICNNTCDSRTAISVSPVLHLVIDLS